MAINHNTQAVKRDLVPAGTWGNLTQTRGSYTTAAMAQNEVAAVVKIPANCVITAVKYMHGALGATTAVNIGFESADGSVSDLTQFASIANTSTAGTGETVFAPYEVSKEGYIVISNPNAAALTGLVQAVVQYEYTNK